MSKLNYEKTISLLKLPDNNDENKNVKINKHYFYLSRIDLIEVNSL